MNTNDKYRNALLEMSTKRSFSLSDICEKHACTKAVGTISRRIGWAIRARGSRRYVWAGPNPVTDSDVTAFMELVREYKSETRVSAPSMAPGARQERRERTEKNQGRRTDRMPLRTTSILWGLVKWTSK